MSAEIICDGCGKRSPAISGKDGNWHKPAAWYERADETGIHTACSRDCIGKITGTKVVLPI